MHIDIENIRVHNPIEEVVAEKFSLRQSGSRFVGVDHDSLVITPKMGFYFWNSKNEHGDVFDFVGRHILSYGSGWNSALGDQFLEAVRYLAQRAGINLLDKAIETSPWWAERQLIIRLHDALQNHPVALAYVTEKRGWQQMTIQLARIGFMPSDKRPLLADLKLTDKWRNTILGFPSDMIVYPHIEKGRLTYLSGRSIQGKQHYNPPRKVIGERHIYYNHLADKGGDRIVIVEGQADAITFAEWGIPAVAICGMGLAEALINELRHFKRVFVALDNTDDAFQAGLTVAKTLGTKSYIPKFPAGVKDANDWLAVHGATANDAASMLNHAQSWITFRLDQIQQLEGLEQQDAIRDLMPVAADLDEFELIEFRQKLAEIGVNKAATGQMLRAIRSHKREDSDAEEIPQILSDDIPILSPALGFLRDLAVVTIALKERTKRNHLKYQPYLVTSNRELHRLNDEQIVTLNGQEIALRVVPEGHDFLMRWSFRDVQRFLAGEQVQPGDAFEAINTLFTTYIDFCSPVDSKILSLWTIGTYFYTMFPAYPYLALNGPKNSGKSTVLRVMQPLAFNMITTSDPTGPAMFRLIHNTSCTVGIDEAERYHSPKDPGMQQIRQLLNSGYKHGMPAIRLVGEEMKPQAFHVYSPKILAAITGLEDILASRCISLPMRRTTRKLPGLPGDFDASAVRHQLYTLAISYFKPVYHNYFERPELHKLKNRSGELWSPLIALAAFFEEVGGISNLVNILLEAALRDYEVSQGKALSDREEAVIQALELLTRSQPDESWLSAAALCHQTYKLLGYDNEPPRDRQWIGHILNRLNLTDQHRRKRNQQGQNYLILRAELLDVMQRYEVSTIDEANH